MAITPMLAEKFENKKIYNFFSIGGAVPFFLLFVIFKIAGGDLTPLFSFIVRRSSEDLTLSFVPTPASSNIIVLTTVIAIGWIIAVARVWDAINDPMMGTIVDKTKSKWGKCTLFKRSSDKGRQILLLNHIKA